MPVSLGGNEARALLRGMSAIVAESIQESMRSVNRLVWHAGASELLLREVLRMWERRNRLLHLHAD
jgi:hypothetical protein